MKNEECGLRSSPCGNYLTSAGNAAVTGAGASFSEE